MNHLCTLFLTIRNNKNNTEQGLIGIFLGFSLIVSAANLIAIIRKYAVNLIFWDQIDFQYPIFTHSNIWTLFTWQHGPHRQGLGELIIWLGTNLSHWNSRIDSYIIGVILVLCTFLAIGIKYKFIGKLQWIDVLIPFIVMTQKQWEQLVTGPNISHSVLPLLLILIISALFLVENHYLRTILQVFITFLCTFTGFGVFAGSVLLVLYIIEVIYLLSHKKVSRVFPSLIGVIGIIGVYSLFLINYVFNPSVDCFGFYWKNVFQYPLFISWMMAKFVGISAYGNDQLMVIAGCALMVGLFAISVAIIKKLFSEDGSRVYRFNQTLFFLIALSLEFMLFTSIGRICLGVIAGQSSRYMTLLIPGIFAFILWLGDKEFSYRVRTLVFIFTLLILTPPAFTFTKDDQQYISNYMKAKVKWRTCYVEKLDIEHCNNATNSSIYPVVSDRLKFELEYLQEHGYNLFMSK